MKNIKTIVLLVFLASIFSACKKYEDGPLISLRTKKSRVLGYWDIKKYLVNGGDSTQSLLSIITCPAPINFHQMDKGDEYCSFTCPPIRTGAHFWFFKDNKTVIFIESTFDTSSVAYPPMHLPGYTNIGWEIQRLTNKDMWLKTNYKGIEYYIELLKSN